MAMKTVDDAIKDFKAVWPDWAGGGDEPLRWCEETKQYFQLNTRRTRSIVCTRAQFSRRVKYLGNWHPKAK